MPSRLYLFIVLCLSSAAVLAEADSYAVPATGVPVEVAESSEQARAALADLAADCSLLIVAPTVASALSGLPLPADTVVAVLP